MGGRRRKAIKRDGDERRLWRIVPILIILGSNLLIMSAAGALPNLGPLNDLLALGQLGGQTPAKVAIQSNPEPPLVATPQAKCGPGSHEEPGVDGRVPAGSPPNGFDCNVTLVSHQGTSGGFKTLRYVDDNGRSCAFYDTALLFPINALKLDTSSVGVAVLDMSDPAHPVQTDTLTQPPMMSPHESLALNPKRGLLAAVLGNPGTYPGLVSIYDASNDCRHPVLQSTTLSARFGQRERLRARRPDVLRDRHRGTGGHGYRRHRPEEPAFDLAGQRPRPRDVAQRRRQIAPTSRTRAATC